MKPFLPLLVMCSMILQTSAQKVKSFEPSNSTFIKQLTTFMSASKKEGKKFVENDFAPAFTESLAYDQQQIVIQTCNELLEKKHPAYPAFSDYLLSIMAYPTSGESIQTFKDYHQVLLKLVGEKRKKKEVNPFLQNAKTLFENRIFYSTNAVQWKFGPGEYKLVYEDDLQILFPEGNLICYSKGDSTRILETGGVYDVFKERWFGEKGKVTWDRAEFDPATTFAVFDDYEVRIKGSSFIIDSVLFYNEYFDTPLKGQLNEKVLANHSGDKASYPKFESYNKRLEIKNLFKNVDYEGGFTMRGIKLAGTGTIEEPAKLVFYREGEPFLVSESLEYSIRPEKVTSLHSSAMFFLDEDTISHPDLNLKFDRTSRKLVLLRSDEGLSKAPYSNTYHGMDMYFEALYWNIDDPLIEMGALVGSTQHLAAFESQDYYKKARYDGMMGIAMTHPLVEIRDYSRYAGTTEFYDNELAGFIRLSVEQTSIMLIELNNQGFLTYNIDTGWVELKPKLMNYLRNNSGARDYDVLLFNSEVSGGNNAQLNLLNNNLLVKGVGRIQLSDSQNVVVYPASEQVVLKKDRDFKCGGRIKAGNFEFMGQEYLFDYETFKLDLVQVDSCRIYVEDTEGQMDGYGNYPKTRVKNVLEDIAGTLKVDAPTNKSGVQSEKYPQYPIFTCIKDSYVFYDNSRIQEGAYDRDRFYYQIEPFVIDSLDNFSKKDLSFNGTLFSSGIFPDIKESLVLMEDNSLGFDMNTGQAGLSTYSGKGTFTADISLSYSGLEGDGSLEYLSSTSLSENFVFLPDSTLGRTTSFENLEKPGNPGVPKASGGAVDITFVPKDAVLKATTVEEDIALFQNEANLQGSLFLKPKGMTGQGDISFDDATLTSDLFDFTQRKIFSDKSAFKLTQENESVLAFSTDNVNAEIDFDERIGKFQSNKGETKIELPANQYICYMDEFKWFMDKDEMELSSSRQMSEDFVIDTDADKAASNFFSVNAYQDSLNFLAPKAIYDIKQTVISCDEIKFIAVADSKVLPDSGHVTIRKRAKMDPLTEATVISNYVTQYHRIFNADLQINGRWDYEGEGDYAYTDENKLEQIIHIQKLDVDTTRQTYGEGRIPEEDEFFLSPFFAYTGAFTLRANEKHLEFDGGTKIVHPCENLERNWFKFNASIDPKEIYIPVDTNLRNLGMSKLGVGVLVSNDSPMDLYSAFLSKKRDRKDESVIDALGYLTYLKSEKKYVIAEKDKIKQPKLPGNMVELLTEDCRILGDGEINYNVDYGHIETFSYGNLNHNAVNGETSLRGTMGIDFFFDEGLTKYLAEQFIQWPDLQAVDITKTGYELTIQEKLGLEKSDKVITELGLTGWIKKIPEELKSTFMLADIQFKWDEVEESFISEGPIGIASMGKKQIFRYVKGKIEIQKSRSADILRVYLELNPDNWFYFEYKLGIMNITTTDKQFVTQMSELKDDKRRIKDDRGNKFTYQLVASKKNRNDFVDRFGDFD